MIGRTVVIAVSARALAQSARRGAREVHAVDAFCDDDTVAAATCAWFAGRSAVTGLSWPRVRRILASLPPGDPPFIVPGSGFERHPARLRELARHGTVCANPPELVAALKAPESLQALLAVLGWHTPEQTTVPPSDRRGWLAKTRGGAGGVHVRRAEHARPAAGRYYQREIGGTPMSVTFLADGETASVLGYNALLTRPAASAPYRYGGVLSGAELPAAVDRRLRTALDRLVRVTGLRGLNGLDFVFDGEVPWVLEINPRPAASMELYDEDYPDGLVAWHIHMFGSPSARGLPEAVLPGCRRGLAVVYADVALCVPRSVSWPEWARDRPRAGSTIPAGAPVFSVSAQAPGELALERLLEQRWRQGMAWAEHWKADRAPGGGTIR